MGLKKTLRWGYQLQALAIFLLLEGRWLWAALGWHLAAFALYYLAGTDPGVASASDFTDPGHKGPVPRHFCFRCNLVQEYRCKHCPACDRCIHRFDHHCMLLDNCVGLYNLKFFYLFNVLQLALSLFLILAIAQAMESHRAYSPSG
jgi:hypothetical protein